MKIWTSEHTYDHKWETVVQAAWRKYPNPFNPAVIGTDVVERKVENGILKSHRLMSTCWGIPGWAKRLLGQENIHYGSEHSEVDPNKKTMTLIARNITFCNLVTIDEKLVYSQHPKDKSLTHLHQEAIVTVKGVPLCSYLEGILTDIIDTNANKGREGLEFVIDKIKVEAAELQKEAKDTMDALNKLKAERKTKPRIRFPSFE